MTKSDEIEKNDKFECTYPDLNRTMMMMMMIIIYEMKNKWKKNLILNKLQIIIKCSM